MNNKLTIVSVLLVLIIAISCFGIYDYFYPGQKAEVEMSLEPQSSQFASISFPMIKSLSVSATITSDVPVDVYVLSMETPKDEQIIENEGRQAVETGKFEKRPPQPGKVQEDYPLPDILVSEQDVQSTTLKFKTQELKFFRILVVNRSKGPATVKVRCKG